MKTEIVDCDLCGCKEYTVIWDKVERESRGLLSSVVIRYDGMMYNGINVQCNNCGLVYVRERLDLESMMEYYKTGYRETYKTNMMAEKANADHALRWLGDCGVRPCKSLDVGCSNGFLIQHLLANKFEAYGLEIADETYNEAVKHGLKVFNESLMEHNGSYGLVTIINTLEHMHSPKKALKKIRELMTHDGLVMISVPNLFTTIINISADAFMSNAHLYTFDMSTIKTYLETTGFEIVCFSLSNENNMQKLYVLAKKGKIKKLNLTVRPRPDLLKLRLQAAEFIALNTYNYVTLGKLYSLQKEQNK